MANKKMSGMLITVLAFGFFAAGCATTVDGGRYDHTIELEKEAALLVGGGNFPTIITKFDDQPVQWNGGRGGIYNMTTYTYKIRIPAGTHTITGGGVGQSIMTTTVRYDFLAGRTYTVGFVNGNFQILESIEQ